METGFNVSAVLGASATGAGIKCLLYSYSQTSGLLTFTFRSLSFILGSSSFSIISGFVTSKMGRNRPAIWFGSTLFTIGLGLMITLDYNSSMYVFFFLSRHRFMVPNNSKRRTRAFPPGRSHWRRLFIPDPDSGTPGSDAYKRHGHCDERLHVPSVSNAFLFVWSV